MNRDQYDALLARYQNGTCTEEERVLLDAWLESLDSDHAQPDAKEKARLLARNWSTLSARTIHNVPDRHVPVRQIGVRWQSWVAAAALTGFLIGIGWWVWLQPERQSLTADSAAPAGRVAAVYRFNSSTKPQRIQLPDSSWVLLQPNSSLRYAAVFTAATREVTLEGKAFFEVKKNPEKPFLVYANDLVTKVLGTSFWVNAQSSKKNVVVSVRTGKVAVYSPRLSSSNAARTDPETVGVVLTPNQQVTYLSQEVRFVKSLVANPVVLVPAQQLAAFTFRNAPVAQVFAAIERVYGVDIVYDEDVMRSCSITTSLNEEDLHQKLTIICKVLGASYKIIDAQVVISSTGCVPNDDNQ